MLLRKYDPIRDRDAVLRIWRESGFVREGKEAAMDIQLACGQPWIAEIQGQAECSVHTAPGVLRYLDHDLSFSGVSAVATSHVARRQGLARQLTVLAVAADAATGALVSGLGMFDQGFYNRLGFGTGGYEHVLAFDPAHLNVAVKPRVPRRITVDDWALVHASRLARARGHGAVNLFPPEVTRMEMVHQDNAFGLGYCDGPDGALSHHLWCTTRDLEHGPYFISWMSYQNGSQFLELLALVKSLADQVRLVRMHEPAGIQMQDLLLRPFRDRARTRRSEYESGIWAFAYWQVRICDLAGCLARTHLPAGTVRFNLHLSDPIAAVLDEVAAFHDAGPWRGVAGDYVVTLGPASGAERGTDPALPTLSASVGAFSRMWLGVRPATSLAWTDELAGPSELLERLDRVLCLPDPKPGWDF
jgi:hypothetical protein